MLHRAATQCIAFSLSREQSEFLFLILCETIAIPKRNNTIRAELKILFFLPDFIVVGRELMKQLFNAIFFSYRVHIRHLVISQRRKIEVDLAIIKY